MSIVVRRICDLCGNPISSPHKHHQINEPLFSLPYIRRDETSYPSSTISADLCFDCIKQLSAVMDTIINENKMKSGM